MSILSVVIIIALFAMVWPMLSRPAGTPASGGCARRRARPSATDLSPALAFGPRRRASSATTAAVFPQAWRMTIAVAAAALAPLQSAAALARVKSFGVTSQAATFSTAMESEMEKYAGAPSPATAWHLQSIQRTAERVAHGGSQPARWYFGTRSEK